MNRNLCCIHRTRGPCNGDGVGLKTARFWLNDRWLEPSNLQACRFVSLIYDYLTFMTIWGFISLLNTCIWIFFINKSKYWFAVLSVHLLYKWKCWCILVGKWDLVTKYILSGDVNRKCLDIESVWVCSNLKTDKTQFKITMEKVLTE